MAVIPALIVSLATVLSSAISYAGGKAQIKATKEGNELLGKQYEEEQKENKRQFGLTFGETQKQNAFNREMSRSSEARAGLQEIINTLNNDIQSRSNYVRLASGRG